MAATWDGAFMDMTPLNMAATVQLQMEDAEELVNNVSKKGKQREGTMSDAQLAMQMYMEDLRACDAVLQDRKMAQSIALAVLRDTQLLANVHEQEMQAVQDRELALRLQNDNNEQPAAPRGRADKRRKPNKSKQNKEMQVENDPWKDEELLSKAAAIYMKPPDRHAFHADPKNDGNDSDITVAESSAWAASRKTSQKARVATCIACGEDKPFHDVARVPCGHEYCRVCLETIFTMSMKDETMFPPRCDKQEIPLSQVRLFLSAETAKEYEVKYKELSTKNRTYCHARSCSAFIPAEKIKGELATCPRCKKTTCTICKGASHDGDCPADEALQQLISTADTKQWQRCYQCRRFVELDHGCNHMTCPCGAEFCYVCGARWRPRSCTCPEWDENRLIRRATDVVDRNPNRRLFQPQRVAHAQPATRPTSPVPGRAALTLGGFSPPMRPNLQPFSSPQLLWESAPSEHSEWEQDWFSNADLDSLPVAAEPVDPSAYSTVVVANYVPTPPNGIVAEDVDETGPEPQNLDARAQAPDVDFTRDMLIADAIKHLRDNHGCNHDKWRWVKGQHQCEECRHTLKQFIFECRQCHLHACNRCRRNRL